MSQAIAMCKWRAALRYSRRHKLAVAIMSFPCVVMGPTKTPRAAVSRHQKTRKLILVYFRLPRHGAAFVHAHVSGCASSFPNYARRLFLRVYVVFFCSLRAEHCSLSCACVSSGAMLCRRPYYL